MEIITQHLCKASDVGLHGNIFGGKILGWLDSAGFLLAAKFCHSRNLVTLKFEAVEFKKPIGQDNLISIYGKVIHIGNTSISIYLEARKWLFDLPEEEEIVTSTTVFFVKIDPLTGLPSPIKNGKK